MGRGLREGWEDKKANGVWRSCLVPFLRFFSRSRLKRPRACVNENFQNPPLSCACLLGSGVLDFYNRLKRAEGLCL